MINNNDENDEICNNDLWMCAPQSGQSNPYLKSLHLNDWKPVKFLESFPSDSVRSPSSSGVCSSSSRWLPVLGLSSSSRRNEVKTSSVCLTKERGGCGAQGAMHQGWGGEQPQGTLTALGEEEEEGRCGDEAQTAHGGAVCRAAAARPGQDLPAGRRRRFCCQPPRPARLPEGQDPSILLTRPINLTLNLSLTSTLTVNLTLTLTLTPKSKLDSNPDSNSNPKAQPNFDLNSNSNFNLNSNLNSTQLNLTQTPTLTLKAHLYSMCSLTHKTGLA